MISTAALPTPSAGYGGIESIAWETANGLAAYHEVTLIGATGSSLTRGRVLESGPPSFDARAEYAAWERYRKILPSFDVVIDHSHAFWAFRAKKETPKIRVLKIVHDWFPSILPPPTGSYDRLFGVSESHARFLESVWGVSVSALYNGVDTSRFSNEHPRQNFLLYFSRLDPGKGAHHFIEACGRLGIRGVVAGESDPAHGISLEYVCQLIRSARSAGVMFRGSVSPTERARLLASARAVVVPLCGSYWECFGLFMIEAMASGTPVITTDRGSPKEIITTGCGIVAADIEELKLAMQGTHPNSGSFSSEACRARASKFEVVNMIKAYERLLDE